jgi:RNA polymerase sigma factor (sigma-70 family)
MEDTLTAMPAAADQTRFLALLDEHRRILHKVARAYGRSLADRDDLVQETAIQLWRAFPKYDPALKFSTWMYRIALNVAISHHRSETARQRVIPAGTTESQARALEVAGMADATPEDEDISLLYRVIGELDDLNRALAMLYLDGQDHREIAAVLGITTTNVATRIGRLKDRLREAFRNAGHL